MRGWLATRRRWFVNSSMHHFWRTAVGLCLVLMAIYAPMQSQVGGERMQAVSLCTEQGVMTVWVSDANTPDDFQHLKSLAHDCAWCAAYSAHAAPAPTRNPLPNNRAALAMYQLPAWSSVVAPLWRWHSPRAPPIDS